MDSPPMAVQRSSRGIRPETCLAAWITSTRGISASKSVKAAAKKPATKK